MPIKPNKTLLIVEDSPEDYEIAFRSFRESGLANPIDRCEDGDEAMDYLYSKLENKDYSQAELPGLILLDLNLPGTDGREVLQKIKRDDRLKKIPVIVLTTSKDERDIEKCYEIGANSYIQKPVGLEGFIEAMKRLKDYWFEIVVFPRE